MNELDPYQTVNSRAHQPFKEKALKGYAKKDVPTYWECEEYPKAWGHGLHHKWVFLSTCCLFCVYSPMKTISFYFLFVCSPLPKDTVPREPLPMRDTMVFKSATKINRVPYKNKPVPHSYVNSFDGKEHKFAEKTLSNSAWSILMCIRSKLFTCVHSNTTRPLGCPPDSRFRRARKVHVRFLSGDRSLNMAEATCSPQTRGQRKQTSVQWIHPSNNHHLDPSQLLQHQTCTRLSTKMWDLENLLCREQCMMYMWKIHKHRKNVWSCKNHVRTKNENHDEKKQTILNYLCSLEKQCVWSQQTSFFLLYAHKETITKSA